MKMRDGSTVDDPRLGRLPQPDERNRQFRVSVAATTALRSYSWNRSPGVGPLNQGAEGSCVGHAFAHELAARPAVWTNITHDYAVDVYRAAQAIDSWPETGPGGEEGTSVLAGAKVLHARGAFERYEWAMTEEELARAVGYKGPAVLGVNWHLGMMRPGPEGGVAATGDVIGGHAILCAAISLKRGAYRLDNSWGEWGVGGSCWISRADIAGLMAAGGEACIPVARKAQP